jgi:hypothetical protein
MRKLSTVARNARELLDAQAKNALLSTLEPVKRWSLDECSIAKIKELRDASIQTAKSISPALASRLHLLQSIGCDAPVDLANANCALQTLRLIEAAPMEQLHLRQATFEHTDARQTVAFANREAGALKERRTALEKTMTWRCVQAYILRNNCLGIRSSWTVRRYGKGCLAMSIELGEGLSEHRHCPKKGPAPSDGCGPQDNPPSSASGLGNHHAGARHMMAPNPTVTLVGLDQG